MRKTDGGSNFNHFQQFYTSQLWVIYFPVIYNPSGGFKKGSQYLFQSTFISTFFLCISFLGHLKLYSFFLFWNDLLYMLSFFYFTYLKCYFGLEINHIKMYSRDGKSTNLDHFSSVSREVIFIGFYVIILLNWLLIESQNVLDWKEP